MANTLTGLVPTIYESLDIVSREMIGFIPAVSRDASGERAALNQAIMIPVTQNIVTADTTPAVTAPNTGSQTITNIQMAITKSKHAAIQWNGEEQRGLLNAGSFANILKNQFVQAFRMLTNEIENDLFTATYQASSRAYGTAGTTPLGTNGDLSDIALTRKILDDNGAPQTDLQLVLGSSAVANLRGKQSLLLKLNESGSSALLRGGSISDLPIDGFNLYNSNAIQQVAKGTGASYTTNTAGYAIGATDITLITGTGTINAGDVITFAGDTNQYVVNTGITAPGTITIASGIKKAIAASAVAVVVVNSATPNMAFSRSAVQLITRAPAAPVGPDGRAMDMSEDTMMFTDPVTGLTFEVALYRQFMQIVYHVRIAWGVKAIKSAHIATLLG